LMRVITAISQLPLVTTMISPNHPSFQKFTGR
jgi:hypothetical protein